MRSLLLLAAVCCLVLSACGSPIARPEDDKEVEVGRQAAAAPAPAPASDDDDDDDDEDDDDDVDGGLSDLAGDDDEDDEDDDEEDDEEEADDEEGDDYLERFFDDILGGDDDDDDDEPAGVQPVVAPVDTVAAAPAVATVEEVAANAEESEAAETEVTEGEEPEAGQKEPASAEVEAPAEAAATPEEDDDDEDDPIDALTPDDDDDDEDDEEDDDEDDELGIARNNSEKHSRALTEPVKKQATVPAIYIVKYNKFVDTILDKMNDILRQSYDPVSVKLQPIDASKKTSKPKKNKTKGKRKSSNKKKNSARGDIKASTTTSEVPATLMEENPKINEVKTDTVVEQTQISESRAIKEKENLKAKPTTGSSKTTKKPPTKTQKPKTKPPTKTTTKKPNSTKNKTKPSAKSKPRAKGTLYGLSSLRRTGDVAVNIMADHTTVKSNFAVGPLILKVEKAVGRGAKKEVKSATATTAEMTGKLSLRINNEGVATLHSIKVLQPKQVRVDSNHERTRELVWKRSSRIAHVVSEKLLSASKPMFHYQPVIKQ